VLRVAARNRMVFQLAEAARERHMLGARDVLVAQEQHAVLEQRCANFSKEPIVANGIGEIHTGQFGADGIGQLFDLHAALLR